MHPKNTTELTEHAGHSSHADLEKTVTTQTNFTNYTEVDDENFKFGFSFSMVFTGLALGFFADNLTIAAISAVLPTINADLGKNSTPEHTDYTWIISAIYTVVSITSPFIGRLSDIFGRKYLLVLGNVIGGVGCIVSALGQRIGVLIVGAVLIGFGNALDILAWASVGEIVPKKHRPVTLGVYEVTLTFSTIFASLIALELEQHTALGWRNIYWICFACHAAAIPILLFFYHPVNQYISEKGKTKWDQVRSLDYVGFILFTIGLCLLLIGLSFGGTKFPWKSAGTLAPLLIGILFIVLTGTYEAVTHSPYNMFPHSVMADFRGFTVICGFGFLLGILYYSSLLFWPLIVNIFFTTDPVKFGLYGMTYGWGALIGSLIAGFVMEKVNQARWFLTGSALLLTVSCGCQAIVDVNTQAASSALVALTGFGIGAGAVISNSMVQLVIPHQYIGVAMGLLTTFRNVGGSIGSTIYQVILANQLTANLGVNIATALAKAGVPPASIAGITQALALGDTTSPALASASPEALGTGVRALQTTYHDALRIVYLVSIAFGVLGTVCSAFSINVGEYMTSKVDVQLDPSVGIHDVHKGGHVLDENGVEITRRRADTTP